MNTKDRPLNAWYGDGTRMTLPAPGAPIPDAQREKLRALRAEFAKRHQQRTGQKI